MNQLYNIPMGFCFQPSDEELIKAFLIPKVKGFPLPWNGIVEKELYGGDASPWDVFRDIVDDNSPSLYCNTKREGTTTKKTLYVFTKVMKAGLNAKKRVFRSAGGGTWSGQTGSKCITDSTTGDIIGFTKMFSFKHKGGDEVFGHWIMHEYSLTAEWSNDFVLCRITRCMKDSVRRPTQLSSPVEDIDRMLMEDDDQEVEGCTLTAEEHYAAFERVLMHSDDAVKSNNEIEPS